MVPSEFQAIILAAGNGNRFPEISEGRPKALLPVGPFPVIFYPLNLLQKHGFSEATIVVLESTKTEIAQKLDKISQLSMKLDYITIPSDSDFGTADTLRFIADKVKADPFIVSCDLITDASLFPAINKFRAENATLVSLMLASGQDADLSVLPGPKPKDKPDRDIILTQPVTERFLYMASMNDFEGEIQFPGHLLRSNGKCEAETKLLDAHVYIMKKWVLDFLGATKFSSIKDKLVPFILKKQMSRPQTSQETDKPMSDFNVNLKVEDIFNFIPESQHDIKITDSTHFTESTTRHQKTKDLIKCFAIKSKESYGLRINNLRSFVSANKKSFTLIPETFPDFPLISPSAKVESTQVTDCIIGENAVISQKTSLKNSIIGANSIINNKTRITDSIILSHVQVGEGVVLENCVVADKVKIEGNCTLKNCVIGAGYIVDEGTEEVKVCLTKSDLFMEI